MSDSCEIGIVYQFGKKPQEFYNYREFWLKNVAVSYSVKFRSKGSVFQLVLDSSFTYLLHYPKFNSESFSFLPFLSAFPIFFSCSCFSHMLNNLCFPVLPASFLYFPSLSKPVHCVKKLPTLPVLVFFNSFLLLFMLSFLLLSSLKQMLIML